ncbi:MAG: type VII secretion protein EssC, partial [Staphylococcus epidermidis]|nr:type VII secretion protein EssC [Staphylococcus epidermidis]
EKVLREELEAKYDFEKIILEDHKLPVGLDFEDVELVSLDVTKPSIITAVKPNEHEYLSRIIMNQLEVYSKNNMVILVDVDENMNSYSESVSSYHSSPSELNMIRTGFKQEIASRKEGKRSCKERKIVFINNIKRFNQITGMNEDEVRMLFNEGPKYNVIVIASGLYSDTIGAFDRESKMLTRTVNQSIIGHKISEQEFIKVKDQFGEPELKPQEMYIVDNQEYKKLKVIEDV